jgi:hypothetical protein
MPPGWRWCTLEEAALIALSSPARKILTKWGRGLDDVDIQAVSDMLDWKAPVE